MISSGLRLRLLSARDRVYPQQKNRSLVAGIRISYSYNILHLPGIDIHPHIALIKSLGGLV